MKAIIKYKKLTGLAMAAVMIIVIVIFIGKLNKTKDAIDTTDQMSKIQQIAPEASKGLPEQIIEEDMAVQDYVEDSNIVVENTTILLNEPVDDKVCLGIFPTEQITEGYYIPDEESQKELMRRMDALNKETMPEGILKKRYSLGINLAYQGLEWQILNDGSLYYYGIQEQTQEDIWYFAEDSALCELALQIAERELGIVPFDPAIIKAIKQVELTVAFSNKKEKVYKQVITEDTALAVMEKLLSEAEVIRGGTGCPFTEGIMTLKLENGMQIKLAMATDSCCVYYANGIYFDYKPTENRGEEDSGIYNNIIFDYFDEVPIATRGESYYHIIA